MNHAPSPASGGRPGFVYAAVAGFPVQPSGCSASPTMGALLAAHPETPAVRWNLARLLSERGRTAAAEPHWTWLRAHADRLSEPYTKALCGTGGGHRIGLFPSRTA